MKKQLTKWEKMFANHISYKELIAKIYKEHIHFNNKNKQPDFKNEQIGGIQITNRHMKRCSSLIIRQIQNEIAMRYHLTSVRMTIIKKTIKNAAENLEKREDLYTFGRNVSWCSHYGK